MSAEYMKEFIFKIGHEVHFKCDMHSTQCTAHCANGQRCKRRCIIGYEFCFSHLASVKHLRIWKSDIHDAGKGLFAFDRNKAVNEIVFKKGDTICEYKGQIVTNATIYKRYENYTAPYAVQLNKDLAIDCACKRGIGSLANTNPGHNNATFSINHRNRTASLKATKNIRNGQEIYLAYGHRYRMNEDTSYVTKNKYVRPT